MKRDEQRGMAGGGGGGDKGSSVDLKVGKNGKRKEKGTLWWCCGLRLAACNNFFALQSRGKFRRLAQVSLSRCLVCCVHRSTWRGKTRCHFVPPEEEEGSGVSTVLVQEEEGMM